MKISKWVSVLVVFSSSLISASTCAGGLVGNGGDILICRPSALNPFNGYYLLDYVATYDYATGNSDVIPAEDVPFQKILAALKEKLPPLGFDLASYALDADQQIGRSADFTRTHIWMPERLGLTDLQDEYLFSKIPVNCYTDDTSMKPFLVQAVFREERPVSTVYHYDSLQVAELHRQSELQYSFLLLHEWLWYYSANANIVRDLNRYLHSSKFLNATASEAKLVLLNLGMNLSRPPTLLTKTIDITSCDPRTLPLVGVSVPVGIETIVQFNNFTNCGFSVFDSNVRYAAEMIDRAEMGQEHPIQVHAPSTITLALGSAYCEENGFDWSHPPRQDVLQFSVTTN